MTRLALQRPRRKPDFSAVMVSIVFLLLLFYLAAGSLIKQSELETDLPVTEDLPLERLPRPLLLVGSEGLLLDGRAIAQDRLVAEVRDAVETASGRPVNLLSDRAMPAAPLVMAISALRSAGLPVRILTVRRNAGATDP